MTKRLGAMPMRRTLASVAIFLLLPALVTPVSAQLMTLGGKFDVSASGAATYSIPITVPAGTAGMAPSLSLSYYSQTGNSSQSSNGILGMGWSLDGLPAIVHCARTVAQDGAFGSINYDANDRFCLDGQRLIVISGTYGADGAQYRTEVESFSRVISHGTAGTGPAWFEVHTKSGQVLQFGNTTDSRVLAQGKTTARSWAVNKVSDTKGNYFTVTYVNDTTNGQAYPSRIDYTANAAAGLAAYNSVQFVYNTARPDITPAYHAGALSKTTVLLTDVKTYAGATLIADYKLAYQQSSATLRSRLASVTLCDGASNCLPATTFAWQNGGTTPTVTTNVAGQDGTLTGYRAYIGDFNGDGLADILWDAESSSPATSTGTRVLWTSTGNGSFTVTSNVAGKNGTLSGYQPVIGDYNRDGRADIWWWQLDSNGNTTGPTTRWTATSSGGFTAATGPSILAGQSPVLIADLNGDSRTDLVQLQITINQHFTPWRFYSQLTSELTQANGSLTSVNALTVVSSGSRVYFGNPSGADFNGDGIADVFGWISNQGFAGAYFGNGDGTFRLASSQDTSVTGYNPVLGDFNGDGNTDILWVAVDSYGRSSGNFILWLSKGDGTFAVTTNPGGLNGTLVGYAPSSGDFNGDGKSDLLWDSKDTNGLSTGTRVLWMSKGDGTFTVVSNFAGQNGTLVGYVPFVADFNGDGKADVLWDKRSGTDTRSQGQRVLWSSDGVQPDMLTAITTGLGATIALTYQPLTNTAVYSKDNNAVDPTVDLQGPMLVVSRVDRSNGIGGTVGKTYAYAGAKADANGRGFLGFRQITATDVPTNIVQTTNYRQDYPYLTLVASQTRTLSGATLSSTTNTYGSTALGGTRYQVFVSQSQTSSFDLDGTAFPIATSTYQYDAYGNATQVVISTGDGFSKTTTNTYTNDSVNWLLGRLTAATVTSQSP